MCFAIKTSSFSLSPSNLLQAQKSYFSLARTYPPTDPLLVTKTMEQGEHPGSQLESVQMIVSNKNNHQGSTLLETQL